MPIYEYNCLECHHEFELMQKFSDPPLAQCPVCSGAVKKLISRSAFHLKGDGWYVTDYARKSTHNGKSKASDSTESSTTPSSPASSTTESTAATPTKETTKATSTTNTATS
jgi:putative FmdB family regulatory protein